MTDLDIRSRVAEPLRSARRPVDGDGLTGLVLGATLVAMALVAGLVHTFSVAVMPNLAGADDRTVVSIAAVAVLARALLLHGRITGARKAGASAAPLAWPPPRSGQS